MQGTIQPIENIKQQPKEEKKKRSSDPVQAEYDDGVEFLQNKEYSQAVLSFQNALIGYEKKQHQDGIANVCNQLGNVCMEKGEFEKAKEQYQRAWDICERFNDTMSLLSLSKQFIVIHREAGEFDKAIKLCLDMIDAHHGHNNPEGVVQGMEDMADIYLQQGDKKKAADVYRSVATMHSNFKHKNFARRFNEKADALEA